MKVVELLWLQITATVKTLTSARKGLVMAAFLKHDHVMLSSQVACCEETCSHARARTTFPANVLTALLPSFAVRAAQGAENRTADAWSAAERRGNDREDSAAAVGVVQELALMPA
jgi:hypothetical protein